MQECNCGTCEPYDIVYYGGSVGRGMSAMHSEPWYKMEGTLTVTLPPNNSVRIGYTDKVIEAVLNKIKTRADAGLVKYGTSMEDNNGDTLYWLRHAQEEAMDLANYLEKLIQKHEEEKAFDPTREC